MKPVRPAEFGMVIVLLGLCLLFSALTLNRQAPDGSDAAAEVAAAVSRTVPPGQTVLVAGAANTGSADLAAMVADTLRARGDHEVHLVTGSPADARAALDQLAAAGAPLGAVATGGDAAKWLVWENLPETNPTFAGTRVVVPSERLWPDFLKGPNLLAIVERIVVIAVIAVGMTMVILTAGIDLSVGSLVALSAVVGARVVLAGGGTGAGAGTVALGFLAGTAACGLLGAASGALVARCRLAPFIVTLGMMLIGRGLAFMTTGGFSIDRVPDAFTWLAQGRLLGVPHTVILLVVVYGAAHVFMEHTRYGRYIYAVGGNAEAARLSGVPVRTVLLLVYTASGLAAGLGGCLQASLVRAAAPNMANMYELYVIAAVVVGGTSLSGGSGRVLGTLVGAFIIAVIQNGMNLLGIQSYTQMLVLGAVIIGAVLLDRARRKGGIRGLVS